ncbi:MAG: acyltransferase [Dysosmobacter welbionis]
MGKHVFINSGCRSPGSRGITIGDGALIGHNAVLATLDHGMIHRSATISSPRPIHIGRMSGWAPMSPFWAE